jgi:hypothetical protein
MPRFPRVFFPHGFLTKIKETAVIYKNPKIRYLDAEALDSICANNNILQDMNKVDNL